MTGHYAPKPPRQHAARLAAVAVLLCALVDCGCRGEAEMTQTQEQSVWRSLATIGREVPTPAPDHPGNVFLLGEEVRVPVPADCAGKAKRWRAIDDRGDAAGDGGFGEAGTPVVAGKLPLGWYRLEFLDASGQSVGWTSAAVLAKLAEPVPQDSPVCVDAATAWFARHYRPDDAKHQEIFAELAALAGVNWIRDRMSWGEEEPAAGELAENTLYDSSATLQAKHGLKVLQVFHGTPGWAVDKELDGDEGGRRFPRDLRAMSQFCKSMAQRYRGRVLAWEPWNEANIDGFGGHTIDDMCTLQKAAYLGFKAGDPDLLVCWNVYAGSGGALHTEGVLENEAWPYFQTYNVHSYSPPAAYRDQHAGALTAACGRPLWITECGIHLPFATKGPWGDLTPKDEIRQAEFVAQSYASSLFAGVNRHFFFILGNYLEGAIQFGLLRNDHTPRPGYVALATVGRLLAGARCVGRVETSNAKTHVYAFRARPDGAERDVLVGWADEPTPCSLPEGLSVERAYDYLGRKLDGGVPAELQTAARFLVLPAGEAGKLSLEAPASPSEHRPGTPSAVVLQLQMPHSSTRLGQQAYEVDPTTAVELPLLAYNFGNKPVTGTVTAESLPKGWELTPASAQVGVASQDRGPVRLRVSLGGQGMAFGGWVKLRGDFGEAGRPVLAFRLVCPADKLKPAETRPIKSAASLDKWEDNIVGGAKMTHHATDDGGVQFDMQFGETDPWSYPKLSLSREEIPAQNFDGLALTVQLLEGKGACRLQFVEENGASYLADLGVKPEVRTPQRVVALCTQSGWGSWSKPDPDGKLQPENIRTVLVGINSERKSAVKMVIRDLEWVRF
ncbi:MAG: hypothetical protein COY42_05885 [Armatimonadetes bacterium CG_4_10_14_0_8_um_filter_66_14]|nr:hypothetical protein [Armatimonadota bacterium]PIX38738.1 MAG: hypothetical protein COZ57_29810 [Armatimonadetes bacterium CG_4_8_14_3_um_filter_66_20]PIZ48671.1 MAG: hypothetical protein COY42_05885 [Armatimonadetes bacterium CG_4_10_14_0_8_um_filter_66_14]